MRRVSPVLLVAAATVATLATGRVHADDGRLVTARRHHQALDFEQCIAVLAQPAPAGSTELDRGDAEVLQGACYFELGQTQRAAERFRSGLRIHPRALLPPNASPKIIDAFTAAQADVRAETPEPAPAAPAPTRPSPAPASPAPDSAPARRGPPILALVLGGAGLVAGGVGTFGYLRSQSLENEANAARFESDALRIGNDARTQIAVANVGFLSAAVLLGAAVVVWLTAK